MNKEMFGGSKTLTGLLSKDEINQMGRGQRSDVGCRNSTGKAFPGRIQQWIEPRTRQGKGGQRWRLDSLTLL